MADLPNALSGDQSIIDYREVGSTGLRRFSGFVYEEFLPELTGWKGVAVYREMLSNDPTVAAVLFAINMLCRGASWRTEAASQSPEDLEANDFLKSCMDDMSQAWIDTIIEIFSFIPYGYSFHEIVYKRRCGDALDPSMRSQHTDGRIGWRKMPIRSQDTVYRWQFDDHGGIQGMEQLAPPHYYHVTIPIEKALLFRTTPFKNNPEGVSALRGAYRPWYMMKNIENIEAIGVERDLAGLPMAYVPAQIMSQNASNGQRKVLAQIQQMVTQVRRNEQEGILMPQEYDNNGNPLYKFELLASAGSRQLDTTAIINRYASRIAMTMLADFVLMGQENSKGFGQGALSGHKINLFTSAICAFLGIAADIFNRFAVPRLFQLNDFRVSKYPKICHGDIGDVNIDELGNYIQKLSGAGMPLFPTANGELEKYLMKSAKMPSSQYDDANQQMPGQGMPLPNAAGKSQIQVPNTPYQTPTTQTDVNDRTPVDGKPKPVPVSTNITGNTEVTGRLPGSQDEDQKTNGSWIGARP